MNRLPRHLVPVLALLTLTALVPSALAAKKKSAAKPYANLTVTYSATGLRAGGTNATTKTVRCAKSKSSKACRLVSSMLRGTAPATKPERCTRAIYGSQTAIITGTFKGRKVSRRLNRAGSCNNRRYIAAVPFLRAAGLPATTKR